MTRRERIFMFVLFVIVAICSVLLYRSQAEPLWEWDTVPSADGYYLRWSFYPDLWPECQRLTINAAAINDDNLDAMVPLNRPGFVVYYVVTAYNAAGESSTGHGPIVPCPVELCP